MRRRTASASRTAARAIRWSSSNTSGPGIPRRREDNGMAAHRTFPALHNAMWPGLVGKGGPGAEPPIDLDTMLKLTAAAQVNGTRFDGVDLFLSLPHTDIDSTDEQLKELADKLASHSLVAGSLVAPVWPPVGGGSAMGSADERGLFLSQVRKACAIGQKLRKLG